MSNAEAIACTFDAYYGVQSRGEMEKAVVNIAEGKIHLRHPKIFFKSKERIIEALNYLDLNKLKMEVNSARMNQNRLATGGVTGSSWTGTDAFACSGGYTGSSATEAELEGWSLFGQWTYCNAS